MTEEMVITKKLVTNEHELIEMKMAQVFEGKILSLSTDLQKILIEDLVTAFENRLKVLKASSLKGTYSS